MKTHLLPAAILVACAFAASADQKAPGGYFQKAQAAKSTLKNLSDAALVYSKIWNEMYGPGKYKLMFKASIDTLDDGTPNVALRYNNAYITVRLEVNDERYEKWKKASHKLIADSHLGFKPKKLVDPWDKHPTGSDTTAGFGKRKKVPDSFERRILRDPLEKTSGFGKRKLVPQSWERKEPSLNKIKAEAASTALVEMADPDARVIGGKAYLFGKAEEAAIKEWEGSDAAQAAKLLVRVTAVDSEENEVGHWDIELKRFKRGNPHSSYQFNFPLYRLSRLKDLPTSVFEWNDGDRAVLKIV